MANSAAFDTSDHVVMKGKVTGLTQMSKKMKLLFFFLGLGFVGFIIFSIFTFDSAAETSNNGADTEQQEAEKRATLEPAKADVVTKGIGDGNAAVGETSPVFDLNDVSGKNAPVIVPTTPASADAKPVNASTPAPAVVVPAPNAATPAATAPAAPTAEEMAAKRAADLRDQQRIQALAGDVEVGGAWGNGGIKQAALANSPLLAGLQGAPSSAAGGFPPPRLPEQDDQNKQVRKESFLRDAESKSGSQFYLKETKQAPVSKYEIKMGWKIPAMLIDGLNSDLPGQVCAQVRENVYDTATGKYLLIPQGTKACGTYDTQIAVGQERFLMVWNRLMFEDGSSLALGGMPGADQAGYAGFDAEVDNHYFRIYTSAIMMSIVSAGMQLSQPKQQGNNNSAPSASQTAAAALGQQIGQTSSALIQRDMKIQPTLTQEPGYRFHIQVTRDIVFPGPFKHRSQ